MELFLCDLSEGWNLKYSRSGEEDEWLSCSVPTNVHLDLLAHQKIPDPFVDFNEDRVSWIEHRDWIYRLVLPTLNKVSATAKVVLALDGLDTFATVKINSREVLCSDNMFVASRVDITHLIAFENENVLEIHFAPALLRARSIMEDYPSHKWVCSNGEASRLAVRKAQYHWSWDWGPKAITCGPWKPIYLEIYQSRIARFSADVTLSDDLNSATVEVEVDIEGTLGETIHLLLEVRGNIVEKRLETVSGRSRVSTRFAIDDPELWYPNGYGDQPLYDISASLCKDDATLHKVKKRIGIRNVVLVQEDDDFGRSFYFKINNIDIFCGGANWIPADSFTPRISEQHYREWLKLVIDGNQTMIRIWGGGIWEPDCFYDICDEIGILVWQDFMFACGNYPCHQSMLESIELECETQLTRLRNHPSIVIYAGNNEDYQIAEQSGLGYEPNDQDPDNWFKSDFPARFIYERLLPDMIGRLCPKAIYHPGSPWSPGGQLSGDTNSGDSHVWRVWHGEQFKYQDFESLGGRFNSEFGMQGFPVASTVVKFTKTSTELFPQSAVMDFHNKAAGHQRRLAIYLFENFRLRADSEGFTHLTQLVQSEAMMYAYRSWRKQWGLRRQCGGALCWQLNDCWPTISWAICDYYLKKKPAYYTIKRTLAPVAVGVQRQLYDWTVPDPKPPKSSEFNAWIASRDFNITKATFELRYISVATGLDLRSPVTKSVTFHPNVTKEVYTDSVDNHIEPHVLVARLWANGEILAQDFDWPQPFKYLSFENRGLQVHFDGHHVVVKAQKPVKGLIFDEPDDFELSDNCIDVCPNEERRIAVKTTRNDWKPLTWRFLGSE